MKGSEKRGELPHIGARWPLRCPEQRTVEPHALSYRFAVARMQGCMFEAGRGATRDEPSARRGRFP